MTISQRYQLEPSDILSINLSCDNCKTSVCIPPQRFQELGDYCPNCRHTWFTRNDERMQKLRKIAGFIADLSEKNQPGPYHVTFEFNLPAI
jgi:Zn-finger nucleic acid-binding protein